MIVIVGRIVLAVGITLMALVVFVLFVFPGGVEVLAVEWERAKRWIRRTHLFLPGQNPLLTKRIL